MELAGLRVDEPFNTHTLVTPDNVGQVHGLFQLTCAVRQYTLHVVHEDFVLFPQASILGQYRLLVINVHSVLLDLLDTDDGAHVLLRHQIHNPPATQLQEVG